MEAAGWVTNPREGEGESALTLTLADDEHRQGKARVTETMHSNSDS